MSAEEREQLRLSLLRFMERNPARFGLSVKLLLQMARSEGRPGLGEGEVALEVEYLEGKGLVHAPQKLVSPENAGWKLTAAGRDYAAMLG